MRTRPLAVPRSFKAHRTYGTKTGLKRTQKQTRPELKTKFLANVISKFTFLKNIIKKLRGLKYIFSIIIFISPYLERDVSKMPGGENARLLKCQAVKMPGWLKCQAVKMPGG